MGSAMWSGCGVNTVSRSHGELVTSVDTVEAGCKVGSLGLQCVIC